MTPEDIVAVLRHNQEIRSEADKYRQEAKATIEELKAQLAWFKKQIFGAKSERQILKAVKKDSDGQLYLGEQMLNPSETPPAKDETVAEYEIKERKKICRKSNQSKSEDCLSSRLKFDESVPVEEVHIKDPELEALSKDQVEIIGENISYKLAQRSAYVVIKTVRTTWKKKGEDAIKRAPLPRVIERSIADVSFLAGLAVDKHCHHLPLYRQHQRIKQAGVHLDRSALTRLLNRVAEMCEPIYFAQLSSILQSKVLTVDETPTPAGRANGKMKNGYYWALYGDEDEVAFIYAPTRSQKVIEELLGNYQGILQSDGYRAYESFCNKRSGVLWAGCWAHTRRKFIEALDLGFNPAEKVLKEIQLLYDIEERGRGKPKLLKALRNEESRLIVDRLYDYFRQELYESLLLPSNRFTKALGYATRNEAPLRVFLENPDVPIDTNHIERLIRYPVMGRKNWMFHTTEDGARYSGILYSLLQTCYLRGIDPQTYLVDVLQRMDTHLALEVDLLTPRLWTETVGDSPMRSLLDC